jgi:hypothetical protein
MNRRRQRITWLVALALVTALVSAPSLLTALPDVSSSAGDVAPGNSDGNALFSGDVASLARSVPDAVRAFLSSLAADTASARQ